ncbi:hypothetical protein KIL84_015614 [Mauremys mutica]|uniref:Uncharacterized protein n=1 Tax=Mauremys mutica TaxID=74926 RepID=A0A9D3WSM9_9SAUR|nr:hypothetical protein KIL84_015614 [Mauremys mutica]
MNLTFDLSACKPPFAFVRRSFVSGSHQGPLAPASWSPTALRPQSHSQGLQHSLPVSKVIQSPWGGTLMPCQVPTASELPFTGYQIQGDTVQGREEGWVASA